jgi:hypothetical protein
MVELEELKTSLDSNPYLTNDIKDNIMELLSIFKTHFKDVDLTNAKERLKTVKVIKGSKFLIKKTSCYNPIDNEILISLSSISDDLDCRHILMRELLNLITAKDNFTGFNKDNSYEALNIGYTELLTNLLVGNESDSEYEDEIIEANLIAKLIGNDAMYNAYFNNNVDIILNTVG